MQFPSSFYTVCEINASSEVELVHDSMPCNVELLQIINISGKAPLLSCSRLEAKFSQDN